MRLSIIIIILLLIAPAAVAQGVTFTSESVRYELELPSAHWRAVPRIDVHEHFEFIYGNDRSDGYLRVREYLVNKSTTPEDLYRREQSRTLKNLSGYVGCAPCKGESITGVLSGVLFTYEFTRGGELTAGRIYYLRVDARTVYSLHFTVRRDKLDGLIPQMDTIARSFRVK